MKSVVAIGWDVGGWHGKGNAVTVLEWTGASLRWLGAGVARLPAGAQPLDAFVAHFCGEAAAEAVRSSASVVVGIDAPLGFPQAFRALLADPGTPLDASALTGAFLHNPLAFRATDRAIAERFPSKAPLSASFDKLGNPATVAIRHTHAWTRGAGPLVTRDAQPPQGFPAVIEVYPALAKQCPKRAAEAKERYRAMLHGYKPDTDVYDAAIAAMLALGWAIGDNERLPRIGVTPSEPGEGAIWYPEHPDWNLPPKKDRS